MSPAEIAMPVLSAVLVASSFAVASLDLRKSWAEQATGLALISGLVLAGASICSC